jgi:hypothetical protein
MNEPTTKEKIDQLYGIINQQKQSLDLALLRTNQQQQILDQYRSNIYNLELKLTMVGKMLEEKSLLAKDEIEKRWPLYLKNDVGVIGPNGLMEGRLKVTFYGK